MNFTKKLQKIIQTLFHTNEKVKKLKRMLHLAFHGDEAIKMVVDSSRDRNGKLTHLLAGLIRDNPNIVTLPKNQRTYSWAKEVWIKHPTLMQYPFPLIAINKNDIRATGVKCDGSLEDRASDYTVVALYEELNLRIKGI